MKKFMCLITVATISIAANWSPANHPGNICEEHGNKWVWNSNLNNFNCEEVECHYQLNKNTNRWECSKESTLSTNQSTTKQQATSQDHPGTVCENNGGRWYWNGNINQWSCDMLLKQQQQAVSVQQQAELARQQSQNIQTMTNGLNQLTNQLNSMNNQMKQRNNSYQGFDASKGLNFRGYGY